MTVSNTWTHETTDGTARAVWLAVLRHSGLVLLIGLLAGVVGFWAASAQEPRYSATSVITLASDRPFDPLGEGSTLGDPTKWAVVQAGVASSLPVLELARDDVKPALGELVFKAVEVDSRPSLNQLIVTATASTPADAKEVADAVSESYREVMAEATQAQAAQALDETSDPGVRANIALRAGVYRDGVSNMDHALLPREASFPKPLPVGLVAGIAGLLLGVGVALLIERWATRHDDPILLYPDLPKLGDVPLVRSSRGPVVTSPDAPEADRYRMVLVALEHLQRQRGQLATILVTPVDGSAVAATTNLAAAMQRSNRRVVLVEIDDAVASVATIGGPSVSSQLQKRADGRSVAVATEPWVIAPDLAIDIVALPACQNMPVDSLRSVLADLADRADFVLVLGGPLLDSPATFAAAGVVDGVVLAVSPSADEARIGASLERLGLCGAPLVGQLALTSSGTKAARRRRRTQASAAERRGRHSAGSDKSASKGGEPSSDDEQAQTPDPLTAGGRPAGAPQSMSEPRA